MDLYSEIDIFYSMLTKMPSRRPIHVLVALFQSFTAYLHSVTLPYVLLLDDLSLWSASV